MSGFAGQISMFDILTQVKEEESYVPAIQKGDVLYKVVQADVFLFQVTGET